MTEETADDDAHVQRLADLQQRLRDSPGAQAKAQWDSLQRSLRVFERNARELVQLLLAAETNEELAMELFQNVRPTKVPDEYFSQLDQRLHNMLASAVSLVDHTRRLQARYEGTDFYVEFTRRNDDVRTADGSVFLRNLRNYLLHYGVLGFVHHISFPSGDSPLVSEVRLNCENLQHWDGWTAPAKVYMVTAGETVHLTSTVQTYVGSMNDLYNWVFDQFEGLHGDDIDAANKLVEEFNLQLTGGVTDGRDWYARMAHVGENLRARSEGREQTSYIAPEAPRDEKSVSS